MPPRDLIGEVVISLVFLNRPAKCRSRLHPRVCRVRHRAERVHRLKIAVAQIAKYCAVHLVRSGTRDDVHYATRSPSIFRPIAVGNDLKLLHGFLRNGGSHAIHGIVYCVGSIHIHQVGASSLTADVEPRRGRCANRRRIVAQHLRIGQRKIDVVTAIDWKIVDTALANRICCGGAGSFDQFRFRIDVDYFLRPRDCKRDRQFRHLPHCDRDIVGRDFTKAGRLHDDRIFSRRKG